MIVSRLTMGFKTKYSQEDKDNALALFLANACNYWKTAKELNIPYPTLRHWVEASPVIANVAVKHKEAFIKTSWAVLNEGMKTLKKKVKSNEITTDELIKVVNCLFEKQALAQSQPTSINKTVNESRTLKVSSDTKTIVRKGQKSTEQGEGARTINLAS